jgi:hydrogenase nickel incorporation protein HypA/HybF
MATGMHELSITQGVVDICEKNATGRRVTAVVLEIGALSGVIPESVEFCFEACTRGTSLDGAKLIIERIPARGRCDECATEFSLKAYYEPCPGCGSYRVTILSGEELRVKELEVD